VYVPPGTFTTKPFKLRSNMTLYIEEGGVIKGTTNWRDYATGAANNGSEGWLWSDCFIKIPNNSHDVTIDGMGTIDGSSCQNLQYGENGNRGPHIFYIIGCTNLTVKNITLQNSGNYNFRFDNCLNVLYENLTLLKGQDGFHSQNSENVRIVNCIIHTPDDNVAGSGNKDWTFENCQFMSNGSGFDFGCLNLTVTGCTFGGDFDAAHCFKGGNFPKEMQTAFRFFSPNGRNPKNDAGNWLIKDCTIDQVGIFFALNRPLLTWQALQDLKSVRFENVKVTNLRANNSLQGGNYSGKSINFVDFPQTVANRVIQVYMDNCSIQYQSGATGTILVASDFDKIEIHNSSFTGGVAGRTFIDAKNGNTLILDNVTGNGGAINTSNINQIIK
ncbi:MAG: glycosyl hydrolase family 28 protein, partial [Candidatus Azobacteroides sp.]|nr:glycosyl hydrolase family 28 protein [Candidatus Azobacteroides sp.]